MSSIINCCFHLLLLPLWRFNPPLMQTPAFANYMLDLLVLQTTTSANHVFLTTSANYYGHISVSPSANDIVTFYKRLLLLLLTSRLSYSYNQLLLLQPYCLILLLLSSDTQFWLKFVIESYQNYLRFFCTDTNVTSKVTVKCILRKFQDIQRLAWHRKFTSLLSPVPEFSLCIVTQN